MSHAAAPTSTPKRPPRPALYLPDKVPDLIVMGRKVSAAGADNPGLFATPSPTPQEISAATEALEDSNTATGPRTRGTVQARLPKETDLRNILIAWGTYLFGIAAKMPGQEPYVYETGGLASRKTPQRNNDPLRLTQPKGYPAGMVHAVCKAAKKGTRVFYGRRISLDGARTWNTSQTNHHVTDFSNIPRGTEIEVQYNMTIDNVTSAWSASATRIVR